MQGHGHSPPLPTTHWNCIFRRKHTLFQALNQTSWILSLNLVHSDHFMLLYISSSLGSSLGHWSIRMSNFSRCQLPVKWFVKATLIIHQAKIGQESLTYTPGTTYPKCHRNYRRYSSRIHIWFCVCIILTQALGQWESKGKGVCIMQMMRNRYCYLPFLSFLIKGTPISIFCQDKESRKDHFS